MLHGLSFKAPTPKAQILYFHGNAGNLESWGGVCEPLVALGHNCLIFDYRSYGKSNSTIKNQTQWFNDAEFMYQYTKQNAGDLPLIVYGRSIGTSSASYLAGKHQFHKLILEASPVSFLSLAQQSFPFIPVKLLFKFPFNNAQHLENNQNTTLLIHGTKDSVVFFNNFIRLKTKFPNFKFLSIDGGGHNNLQVRAYDLRS